jgi:hypothetical protein
MRIKIIVLLSSFLIFTGCVTVLPPPPMEETSFYLARYDKVWTTTLDVLDKQSILVLSSDKSKGTITTSRFVNFSVGEKAHNKIEEIAYRPELSLGLYTHVHYSFTLLVVPNGEMSTQVKAAANIEAYDTNLTHRWHGCVSKNVVERELLEKIRAAL